MRPYHTIAVPDRDILEGRFEYSIFAADLWEVVQGRAPVEYRDREEFFRKTFITHGLETLLRVVERRLTGGGGDPVIQLQTPFGGGKTHSLIALYHKGQEWGEQFGAKVAVFSGQVLEGRDRLWELLEEQLTGEVKILKGEVAPGRDRLMEVLKGAEPVLILIDELLLYLTKGAGVKIGESTMAAQTLVFLQELTEVMGLLERGVLVLAYPSQPEEDLGEVGALLLEKLKKVSGRVESIYTPVEEWEISQLIRKRLFSSLDQRQMEKVVAEVVEQFRQENLLPAGEHPSQYRERFRKSYPFLPEVVEILYNRWGSFPKFQRTRGVLRLLAMVIGDTKESPLPYISLADFNLSNPQIREELLRVIGPEYNSVIGADITGPDAGAKRADLAVGDSYRGLKLGTRTATTIFLYSFSGGERKGATREEVKRVATTPANPASLVGEVLEELRSRLFYLQYRNDLYFFTNQPNLNQIKLVKKANLDPEEVRELERRFLEKGVIPNSSPLKPFIWIEESREIPDTPEFKLVILPEEDLKFFEEVVTQRGELGRVYQNNIFFLVPEEMERRQLEEELKEILVIGEILRDETLNLTPQQRRELEEELKLRRGKGKEGVRRAYRVLYLPREKGFRRILLPLPAVGVGGSIPERVFGELVKSGKEGGAEELLERVTPTMLLPFIENGEVEIKTIFETGLRVRGEDNFRFLSLEGVVESVKDGVREGIFGVARGKGEKPICGEEGLEEVDGSWWVVEREKCQEGEEQLEETLEGEKKEDGRVGEGASVEGGMTEKGERGIIEEGNGGEGTERNGVQFGEWSGFGPGLEGVKGDGVGVSGGKGVESYPGGLEFEGEGFEGGVDEIGVGGGIGGGVDKGVGGGIGKIGIGEGKIDKGETDGGSPGGRGRVEEVHLSAQIPTWGGWEVLEVLNRLTHHFQKVEIEIKATDGQISEEELEELKRQLPSLF